MKRDIIAWFYERSQEEISYLLGMLSFVLFFIVLLGFMDAEQKKEYSYLIFIPFIFFLFGFASYLLTQSILIKSTLFKYIVAPASLTLGASVSHALSKQIINLALEVPASPFIHTQAILTVFLAPLILVVTFAFSGLFLTFLLFVNFSKLKNFEFLNEFKTITPIVRVIVFITIWSSIFGFLSHYSEPYTKKLEAIAKWSVYNLESELFSYCKKDENERVSYVASDVIIIGKEVNGEYHFSMQKCINKL